MLVREAYPILSWFHQTLPMFLCRLDWPHILWYSFMC